MVSLLAFVYFLSRRMKKIILDLDFFLFFLLLLIQASQSTKILSHPDLSKALDAKSDLDQVVQKNQDNTQIKFGLQSKICIKYQFLKISITHSKFSIAHRLTTRELDCLVAILMMNVCIQNKLICEFFGFNNF